VTSCKFSIHIDSCPRERNRTVFEKRATRHLVLHRLRHLWCTPDAARRCHPTQVALTKHTLLSPYSSAVFHCCLCDSAENTIRRLIDRRCAARGLARQSDEIWSFHKGSRFHPDWKSCLCGSAEPETWDHRVQPENAACRESAECFVSPNHVMAGMDHGTADHVNSD